MGGTAKESYEQEQTRLREQYDGKKEIRIEAPKEPEVNPEVYRDVEALLYRGFILLPAELNGVRFVFKSLNQHEFETIRLFGGLQEKSEPTAEFWALFLAYCVLIVDGLNVLADRRTLLPQLSDTFSKLPLKARQRMVRNISEINRRASNAVVLTEAYAMEPTSRFRWGQLHGLDLTSPSVTGIEGTERVGLNWAQLLWRALNYFEDLHIRSEQEWENAKFVGSCFAGKGMSKVHTQDQTRRDNERLERSARKDALLRHVLLGDPLDTKDRKGGMRVISAHTVEELAEQLEHDLRGEQDFHDQVVQAHEERVRQQYQDRRRQLEELSRQREIEYEGKTLVGSTNLEGLRPDEVQQRVLRRKQLAAQQASSRLLPPELSDPKMAGFLEKWGVIGQEVQSEVTRTDRDVSNVVALPAARTPGTPFRR